MYTVIVAYQGGRNAVKEFPRSNEAIVLFQKFNNYLIKVRANQNPTSPTPAEGHPIAVVLLMNDAVLGSTATLISNSAGYYTL